MGGMDNQTRQEIDTIYRTVGQLLTLARAQDKRVADLERQVRDIYR